MSDRTFIPADRLMHAVDAILVGLAELGDVPGGGRPSKLLGHPLQPASFVDCTRLEIEEAERFLIRCGLLTTAR